ncbi:MAG: hypothetical protein JNJ53_01485 [Rhizobiales bacterium]|nr:hypothetical protein [Hyphomicrobiales bacterium]
MEIPTISKPMRDLIVQVLATVMIPLTIAGTGLYYTRWQQNLNDLKTMIDLVSDQSADRRKYGVAMFEYLLKNDKVPVEFVAAQLDYANSSSDKDLLPLMEGALMKASAENPSVAETFRLALDRLPSRLFVHVLNDNQADCVRKVFGSLKDIDRGNIAVPSIIEATWGGTDHELRVLQESDLQRARDLVNMFNGTGLRVKLVDLSQSWAGAKKVRPNTMELWLGTGPLPAVCTATAGN